MHDSKPEKGPQTLPPSLANSSICTNEELFNLILLFILFWLLLRILSSLIMRPASVFPPYWVIAIFSQFFFIIIFEKWFASERAPRSTFIKHHKLLCIFCSLSFEIRLVRTEKLLVAGKHMPQCNELEAMKNGDEPRDMLMESVLGALCSESRREWTYPNFSTSTFTLDRRCFEYIIEICGVTGVGFRVSACVCRFTRVRAHVSNIIQRRGLER